MKVNLKDWYSVEHPEVGAGRLHGDLIYCLEEEGEILPLPSRPCLWDNTELRAEEETGKTACKFCLCFPHSLQRMFSLIALSTHSTDLFSVSITKHLRLHTLQKHQVHLAQFGELLSSPNMTLVYESHIHTPIFIALLQCNMAKGMA